jgi:hypothetical protein
VTDAIPSIRAVGLRCSPFCGVLGTGALAIRDPDYTSNLGLSGNTGDGYPAGALYPTNCDNAVGSGSPGSPGCAPAHDDPGDAGHSADADDSGHPVAADNPGGPGGSR